MRGKIMQWLTELVPALKDLSLLCMVLSFTYWVAVVHYHRWDLYLISWSAYTFLWSFLLSIIHQSLHTMVHLKAALSHSLLTGQNILVRLSSPHQIPTDVLQGWWSTCWNQSGRQNTPASLLLEWNRPRERMQGRDFGVFVQESSQEHTKLHFK